MISAEEMREFSKEVLEARKLKNEESHKEFFKTLELEMKSNLKSGKLYTKIKIGIRNKECHTIVGDITFNNIIPTYIKNKLESLGFRCIDEDFVSNPDIRILLTIFWDHED